MQKTRHRNEDNKVAYFCELLTSYFIVPISFLISPQLKEYDFKIKANSVTIITGAVLIANF